MLKLNKCTCFVLTILSFTLLALQTSAQKMPKPADLIEYEKPRFIPFGPEVALSSDGEMVIYKTRRPVVDSNEHVMTFWKIPTNGGELSKLNLPDDARNIEWLPENNRVAYLAPAERGQQVWIKTLGERSATQMTNQKAGVRNYSISPDGNHIAYTVAERSSQEPNDQPPSWWQGVTVNQRHFLSDNLFADQLTSGERNRPTTTLWIMNVENKISTKVNDTLSVGAFQWSPSGDRIAFTAAPYSEINSRWDAYRKDLYMLEVENGNVDPLLKDSKRQKVYSGKPISYSSPFWSPSGDKLGFVRTDHSNIWSAVGEVGVMRLKDREHSYLTSAEHKELNSAEFFWFHKDNIYVEFTDRAKRGLFSLSVPDGKITTIYNPAEHATAFSFSKNAQTAVWVEESMGQPPEIYYSRDSFESSQQLTALNKKFQDIWLPEVRYIEWTSTDGTKVNGWLLEPKDSSGEKPYPLLTHVHGGPGATAGNTFHPNRAKKYPLQIFASRGYAVFISNYRGTNSFGKAFQEPEATDKEPVEDIVTGIEHLISKGIADKDRLGIMGHSHGGWLAPMVVAKYPNFQAASISEGLANFLSLYGQMPGSLNMHIHEEVMASSSPYENPMGYLELSPAFRENFYKTAPTLLEYGQEKLAIQGLEMGKALWRHGTPYELVIYPDTGHNIFEPKMNVESMQRNLQWFSKWMQETDSVNKIKN